MIYAERIRLRAPERADLPQFVAWLNDPEVKRNLSLTFPLSLAAEENWFEDMLKRSPAEQALTIEVRLPDGETWIPIGNCSLMDINWLSRSAEFGIFIGDKTRWNQGYGTEATRLMLKHGFETLNLHRIFLRVFATNPRARRAYEKAGYILEGTQRQAHFLDGQYIDVYVMSVLQPEYLARQSQEQTSA
jgi:RimJ/RimL family protein N-acetyltransferase